MVSALLIPISDNPTNTITKKEEFDESYLLLGKFS